MGPDVITSDGLFKPLYGFQKVRLFGCKSFYRPVKNLLQKMGNTAAMGHSGAGSLGDLGSTSNELQGIKASQRGTRGSML